MRRTLIALSLFTVCGVAPAAANPVFEAGEFHLELSGGATYLDLPALRHLQDKADRRAAPVRQPPGDRF